MAETWRVVLASGEVREVEVSRAEASGMLSPVRPWHGWRAARTWDGPVHAASEAMGDSAEEACARLAVGNGLAVREILAPGEPTRAELRAQVEAYAAQLAPMTRAVDALRAAAVAAGHPAADGDPDAQLRAVRAKAWSEGAAAVREVIAKFYEVRADFLDTLCVDAIVDDESEDYGRFCEAVDAPSIIRNIPVPPCPEVSR